MLAQNTLVKITIKMNIAPLIGNSIESLFFPKEQWQAGPKDFIGCNSHLPSSENLISDFLVQNDRRFEYHAGTC